MPRTKMIAIDYDKFIAEVKKTNVPLDTIAGAIGYSSVKVFSNAKTRRTITEHAAVSLERIYSIKRDKYEIAKKPEPKTVEEKQESTEEPKRGIDYVALFNTIYQAVLTALRTNATELHDKLFNGEK